MSDNIDDLIKVNPKNISSSLKDKNIVDKDNNNNKSLPNAGEGKQNKKDRKSDRRLRKKFAHRAYILVCLWSLLVAIVIMLDGSTIPEIKIWFISFKPSTFHLSDKIVITLISCTTINIVAVLIVVMKNLFPHTTTRITKNQ